MNRLSLFFLAIENDPTIGASHISIYCALLQYELQQCCGNIVELSRSELMKAAKIAGIATFHKCVSDLDEHGFIRYQPSYNHRKKNRFYLM